MTMKVGTFFFFAVTLLAIGVGIAVIVSIFHPSVMNKAGPDWIWRLGKYDPVRNLFFRQDGSLRRYGRVCLLLIITPGLLIALFLLVTVVWALFVGEEQ